MEGIETLEGRSSGVALLSFEGIDPRRAGRPGEIFEFTEVPLGL